MSQLSGQYRVVVIGGGMMGVSTLYHLAKEGWKDVLLIEKGEISSGSTWHAAGQCPHFAGSYSLMKIHDYGIKTYSTMPETLGHSAGWHGCGGVRLAYSEAEVSWFKHIQGIARLVGAPFEIIPPEEIAKVHPYVNLDGVIMGAQTFTDGHTDPSSGANGFVAGAKALGATVSLRNRVLGIKRQGSSWIVQTENGTVHAEHVVNAGGSYADAVSQMVGKRVPLTNMVHQYVVTEAVPELMERDTELPVIRDPWCKAYLRQEQKGLLIGPYENTTAQTVWQEKNYPNWDFEMELLPEELERIMPWLEQSIERLPLFGTVGLKRVICGAITHSPDGNFLVGPAAGLENFWQCNGAGIGIAQGPGVGKYLAQWMVHGEAEINMSAFDPRRFGDWAIGNYTVAKSIDDYEHMYSMHHPDIHRSAGRPVRASAFDSVLRDADAHMTEAHGWERPIHFDGAEEHEELTYARNNDFAQVCNEAKAIQDGVGLVDLSSFSSFTITGSDSSAFLDSLTPARLPRVGRAALCHALNDNGTFLAEWTITHVEDNEYIVFSGAGAEATDFHLLQLAETKFNGNVQLENTTEAVGSLLLTGPKARDILGYTTDSDLSTAAMPWMSAQLMMIDDCPTITVRMSYAGALGYEIHTDPQHLLTIHNALKNAAEEQGENLTYVGFKALNGLRLEKSFPAYGTELTNEVTFIEAGMTRFWDRKKDNFRGKIALEAAERDERTQMLVYLSLDTAMTDSLGVDAMGTEPIYAGEDIVGLTTSGGYGVRVGKSLGFGYITPEAKDQNLHVLIQGAMIPLTILEQPAFDPDYSIIRA